MRATFGSGCPERCANGNAIRPTLQGTLASEAASRLQYLDDAELSRVQRVLAIAQHGSAQIFDAPEQPARDLPLGLPVPERDPTHQLDIVSRR
jgi:hypothetical protein